jgi:hypothetical protein
MQTQPLELFPNSGHHYVFLRFGNNAHDWFPDKQVPQRILDLCLAETDPWRIYQFAPGNAEPEATQFPDAASDVVLPWVRWRYGSREVGSDLTARTELGIWVAVETNLGGTGRGAVVQPREPITARPVSPDDGKSPYFAESERSIPSRNELLLLPFSVSRKSPHDQRSAPRARSNQTPDFDGSAAGPELTQTPIDPIQRGVGGGGAARAEEEEVDPMMPPPWEAPTDYLCIEQCVVRWAQSAVEKPVDVEIVIDFGNSRTTVLLLEMPLVPAGGTPPPLANLITPVRFLPRGQNYTRPRNQRESDPLSIIDSWFILHETMFSDFVPPRLDVSRAVTEVETRDIETKNLFGQVVGRETQVCAEVKRIPQIFVEMAPCTLGEEAKRALGVFEFRKGSVVHMSSPKRYTWDLDTANQEQWGMVTNRWSHHEDAFETPALAGFVLSYLFERPVPDDTKTEDWPFENPPNLHPDPGMRPNQKPKTPQYPRSDAIVWVGLALLESAYRQLLSSEYRAPRMRFVPRRLRSVSVTFPPGWTGKELRIYRRKWQTAVNIFAHTHLDNPKENTLELYTEVDEGFASQLPFVFGEIQRMDTVGENWIALVGRRTPDNQNVAMRMMTVDIGGGTTDISVVQYEDRQPLAGVQLACTLLYRDSSTTAGDAMLKSIIEEVLLPELGQIYPGADDRQDFTSFFREPRLPLELQHWKRAVQSVIVPIVLHWLETWSKGLPPDFSIPRTVDSHLLDELNRMAVERGLLRGVLNPDSPISYNYTQLEGVVRRTFSTLFQSLARIVALFGVDMVVMTGKPSELPGVRQLLERVIPLPPCRLISAKNHPIGDWYPFSRHERIYDAKTVTAVGAALFRALNRGLIPGWQGITLSTNPHLVRNNCWMEVTVSGKAPDYPSIYLNNDPNNFQEETDPEDEDGLKILIGTRIGRALLPTQGHPEPVYMFRWKDRSVESLYGRRQIRVWLARERAEQAEDEVFAEPEYLIIKKARLQFSIDRGDGQMQTVNVTEDDVELQLCTLPNNQHWLDNPSFSVPSAEQLGMIDEFTRYEETPKVSSPSSTESAEPIDWTLI